MINAALTHYKRIMPEDLQKLAYRDKWVTGTGVVKTWNEDNWLHCESLAIDERAWCYYNFYMPAGSIVEITCEAKDVGLTSNGRMSIDLHDEERKLGGDTADYVDIDFPSWKPYTLTYQAPKDSWASATFGVWKNFVGSVQFRNIEIKVYNGTPVPDLRFCVIKCDEDGVWSIDDKPRVPDTAPGDPMRFSNQGCISIDVGTDVITVKYVKFRSWFRPMCQATLDFYGGEENKHAKTGYAYQDSCQILLTDSTGAKLNPKLQKGMFINFMAMAY